MTTHKCALRALSLCDGQRCEVDSLLKSPSRCYCEELDQVHTHGHELAASELRHARAQAVARAHQIERTRELRRLLERAQF